MPHRLTPHPADPIDPVGQALRDIDRSATALQFIDPVRLYGDLTVLDGAILALTIIQQRVRALQPRAATE